MQELSQTCHLNALHGSEVDLLSELPFHAYMSADLKACTHSTLLHSHISMRPTAANQNTKRYTNPRTHSITWETVYTTRLINQPTERSLPFSRPPRVQDANDIRCLCSLWICLLARHWTREALQRHWIKLHLRMVLLGITDKRLVFLILVTDLHQLKWANVSNYRYINIACNTPSVFN